MGIRPVEKLSRLELLSILTQRSTFPIFPDGAPGFGLILLRIAVSATLLYAGVSQILSWRELRMSSLLIATLAATCGLLLLFGLFNRLGCSVGALIGLGVDLALIPVPVLNISSVKVSAAFTVAIAIALLCLGPGAYSLDARRYGRREIIIPARPRSSENRL
jgi:uncharacterized membrane protein YphA (DoxX/SURF4 family)